VSISVSRGWARSGTRPFLITVIDGQNMPNLGNRNRRVYGPIASIEALQNYVKDIGAGWA
jgi:3-dehydroquinate dehydratase II